MRNSRSPRRLEEQLPPGQGPAFREWGCPFAGSRLERAGPFNQTLCSLEELITVPLPPGGGVQPGWPKFHGLLKASVDHTSIIPAQRSACGAKGARTHPWPVSRRGFACLPACASAPLTPAASTVGDDGGYPYEGHEDARSRSNLSRSGRIEYQASPGDPRDEEADQPARGGRRGDGRGAGRRLSRAATACRGRRSWSGPMLADGPRAPGGLDLRRRQRPRAGARGLRRPRDARARRSRATSSPRPAPTPCSPRSGPSPGPPGRS